MRYSITVDVVSAQGYQVFEVEAESKEKAYAKFCAGEGDIVHEEIEITELGEFRFKDIELSKGQVEVPR